MNPNHGNGIHECNPNFPWLSQNPPPLINYSQNQPFQYMNNNQNPTFPTSSNNPLPFPPFYVLESTPYQPYQPQNPLGVPFSFKTPPSYLALNPILVPGTSVSKIQVLGIIESGDTGSENDVKELYIGSYPSAANDPYYSIRKKLISPFFPYIEVTGSWPDEVQDDGGEASGVGMGRSRKKKNILSYITWNSASTSNFPDPEPPIPKMNKNLKFLLMKELRRSDVNYFKRIILPKHEAENHLPTLNDKKGVEILARDVLLPVTWRMKFRFWYNNRSRIYVLEHTGDFVKKHELKCDDAIALYEDDTKHLYIYAKKNQLSDSTSNPQVITTEGINNPFPNPIENLENNRLNAGERSSSQGGSTNYNDISYYVNRIEELLYEDEYSTPISTNDIGLNAGESSLHQEGFVNFDAIGDSVFDEHYGIPTNYGSINAGEVTNQIDVSSYFNEQPGPTVFDEYGIPRIDLWPQNQDNWTFK